MPLPLAQLIAEAEREAHMRINVYEKRVRDKKMSQVKADYQIQAMEEIASVLQRLADNLPMFRLLAEQKRITQEYPEVKAVLDAFPGAEVVGVTEASEEAR